MPRRSEEQRIAELEAQIVALKARAAESRVKKDPALKYISKAIKAVDIAASETKDTAMREALEQARSTLAACLQLQGVLMPAKASGPRRVVRGDNQVNRDDVLNYVRSNPGSRGEQIASALGTDVKIMRPVMKELIADRKVRTAGERRGMTYSPA